jgi:ribonucleoside-diphosphate reductase alpha chain
MSLGFYYGDRAAMVSDVMKRAGMTPLKIEPALTPAAIIASTPLPSIAETVVPTKLERRIAKQMGYTGNECQTCGSSKMKVSGHCEVCEDCGNSSGCS